MSITGGETIYAGRRVRNSVKFVSYDCRCKKTHLELHGSKIDRLAAVLGGLARAAAFAVTTPCVGAASSLMALIIRQRIAEDDRPHEVGHKDRVRYKQALNYLFNQCRDTGKFRQADPSTIPAKYSGTKRRHYEKCYDELKENGYVGGYFSLMTKWGECSHRVRAIIMQVSRAAGTSIVKAGEVLRLPILLDLTVRRPLESSMKALLNSAGRRLFACGMTPAQRATEIEYYVTHGYRNLSIDASSFDGSQGWLGVWERQACLKHVSLEHYPGEVKLAMKEQDFMTIKAEGIRAKLFGNRASGTGATATGNKMVMTAALVAAFGNLYHEGLVTLLNDGDDCLVFVHESLDDRTVMNKLEFLTRVGLNYTVDGQSGTVAGTQFCRARPVHTANGWTLVKLPIDAIKTLCCVRRHFRATANYRDYCATLAVGYRILWRGVPVLSEAWRLFQNDGTSRSELLGSSGLEYMLQGLELSENQEPVTVTGTARATFFEAFGIPPHNQVLAEELLRSMTGALSSLPDLGHPEPSVSVGLAYDGTNAFLKPKRE